MKARLLSAAAIVAVAVTPAVASVAPGAGRHEFAMEPITRDAMIQKVQEHFAQVDTNKDGFVTKEEADAAREAIHAKMADHREEAAGAIFDRIDTNKDGQISRQEFEAAHQAMMAHGRDGPDGSQQAEGRGRPRRGAMMMHHAAMDGHIFEMADSNKDGKVSLAEATAAAAAHFDKADANHDGTLTPEEMRAAFRAMHGKMSR